jgi:hypothetical protein
VIADVIAGIGFIEMSVIFIFTVVHSCGRVAHCPAITVVCTVGLIGSCSVATRFCITFTICSSTMYFTSRVF